MKSFHRLSLVEQTTEHLRGRLRSGQWNGKVPGVVRLCADWNVSQGTIRAALRKLEVEGLLVSGGRCRSRRVAMPVEEGRNRRGLTVGLLLHDARPKGYPKTWPLHLEPMILEIQHALEAAGHQVFFAARSQVDLGHNVSRIRQQIAKTPADAWIVAAGSRDSLEWFAGQPLPSMALFGRADGLPLARTGPDMVPAVLDATRQLIALGHQRIVLITRSQRRKPMPGNVERAFLDELHGHGIAATDWNLPDWQESPQGFTELLDKLFRIAPPTAMIIDETARYIAALQFLSRMRMVVPEQISLVSADYDNALAWCHPTVSHIKWNMAPVVRRIVRWVAAVQRGREDRQQINYPATFVAGGSIGPLWNR
jgi:DNA-binding LacI/PurR family transcriptional regulator